MTIVDGKLVKEGEIVSRVRSQLQMSGPLVIPPRSSTTHHSKQPDTETETETSGVLFGPPDVDVKKSSQPQPEIQTRQSAIFDPRNITVGQRAYQPKIVQFAHPSAHSHPLTTTTSRTVVQTGPRIVPGAELLVPETEGDGEGDEDVKVSQINNLIHPSPVRRSKANM